jgi:hypothetical protein
MLGFLRKNAGSWVVRIVLGILALSFVLFFGFQASNSRSLDAQTAALVGDQAISFRAYQRNLDEAMKRMRANFDGEVPDNFASFLQQNVLQQLVQRQVLVLFAERLGFVVSDREVALFIRKQKAFYRDGIFDLDDYRNNFSKRYRSNYGQDFEEAVRHDLLLEGYNAFVDKISLESSEEQLWKKTLAERTADYEVITFSTEELKKHFKEKTNENKAIRDHLSELLGKWKQGTLSKKILKKYAATKDRKNNMGLAQRKELLGQNMPFDVAVKVLSLNKGNAYIDAPVSLGRQWYLIRWLAAGTHKDESPEDAPSFLVSNPRLPQLMSPWVNEFGSTLKIQRNIVREEDAEET